MVKLGNHATENMQDVKIKGQSHPDLFFFQLRIYSSRTTSQLYTLPSQFERFTAFVEKYKTLARKNE
jgi:hypothetical protein